MKVSCEIIKDLLPLYNDEVCSTESKKIIDEHLLECESCKKIFAEMNTDIKMDKKYIASNMKEASELMNLSKKWNKKLIFEIVKGIGIGIFIMIVMIMLISIFVGIKLG